MINVNEAAEMHASFDNQTPFSPKIEEDSEAGKQLPGESARRDSAHARQGISARLAPESNWAIATSNSPICVSDGTPPPVLDQGCYIPIDLAWSARAACLAKDGRSTLDLFGKRLYAYWFFLQPRRHYGLFTTAQNELAYLSKLLLWTSPAVLKPTSAPWF